VLLPGVCPASWQVFGLINIVIERMGEDITPSVQGLLPLLPQIWQEAHDQSLLRIQVGGAQPSISNVLYLLGFQRFLFLNTCFPILVLLLCHYIFSDTVFPKLCATDGQAPLSCTVVARGCSVRPSSLSGWVAWFPQHLWLAGWSAACNKQ
jgi:hypothetical protein